jgi:hydroxyproline oxidase
MLRYAATNRELIGVIQKYARRGERVILDYARENCDLTQAPHVKEVTKTMIRAIPPGSMCALKFTSFGSRENEDVARDHVTSIVEVAAANDVDIALDAEDVLYPHSCYEVMHRFNTKQHARVYKTYQMYRRDAFEELLRDIEQSHKDGFKLGAKLVRGAYLNTQRNLFHNKDDVDHNYNKALHYTCTAPHVHAIVATHNAVSLRIVRKFDMDRFVTAKLMGFDEGDRVDYRYVPYGTLAELAPYLLRRLRERLTWSS